VNDAAASTVAPTSTVAAAQSSAADRRKADRPWTGNKPVAAAAPKVRASTTRIANGAEDTEWKEF